MNGTEIHNPATTKKAGAPRKITPSTRPDKVETDAERRQMFGWIIDEYGGGPTAVSVKSGISRAHIEHVISGHKQLSSMGLETVQKLLRAVRLPANEMRDLLNLPDEYRERWTTLQPVVGSSGDPEGVRLLRLDRPVVGVWTGPENYALKIDTRNAASGLVVCVLPSSFLVTPFDQVPDGARILGQLLYIDTSIRREVIPRALEDWLI